MELYSQHLHIENTVQHARMFDLMNMNYRPEYEMLCVVPSDENEHAYLVGRVRCLDTPYEPDVDVLEHRVTTYICSCDDFYFNRSMGVDSGQIRPPEMGRCKHIIAAFGVDPE